MRGRSIGSYVVHVATMNAARNNGESTMTTTTKSAIETLVAAWNSGDINRIAACYADNTKVVHPMAGTLDGRAAVKAFESGMFDAFSELDWKAVKVIDRGDEVALEFCVKALNSKPMATPKGQLPATNKR